MSETEYHWFTSTENPPYEKLTVTKHGTVLYGWPIKLLSPEFVLFYDLRFVCIKTWEEITES